MQEIWRNSWVVSGGGAWVAVWFEEVGGGGRCSHGFQEEPKGISHCQQSMKGATFGN